MRFNILCCTLLLALVAVPRVSFAEGASIAVVNVRMLMTDSKAAKSLQKKLSKQRTAFGEELAEEEKALRAKEQDFVDKRSSLSQDELVQMKKEFEEQLSKSRGKAQTKRAALDKANAKAMNALQNEIVKAVQKVSDEQGYDLVMSRQGVVVLNDAIDISDAALKQLNSAVSDIALDVPK